MRQFSASALQVTYFEVIFKGFVTHFDAFNIVPVYVWISSIVFNINQHIYIKQMNNYFKSTTNG